MKKKFDWDEFCNVKNKIAMHCKTEEEAIIFCNMMYERGLNWSDGTSYLNNCDWNKNFDCYENDGTHDFYEDCKRWGYKIYEFSDFYIQEDSKSTIHIPSSSGTMTFIKIKYHNPDLQKLEYIDGKSDWIDLRAAENVTLKQGEFKLISLGVSMQLPDGYEAHVVPRSSTFKNFGVLQTNSFGVIDETYCGQSDIWMFPALAMRDTEIHVNDRICQFRIEKHQPHIKFDEVDKLDGVNRGGWGSTGKN